jgi:hypothetical protein
MKLRQRKIARLALALILPFSFMAAMLLLLPLRTRLEFGPDEGYELMKAFLVSLGHPLYLEIWNDQPPLHTEFLALLFRCFGPFACVGRLLSVILAGVMLASLHVIATWRSGIVAGISATVLLALNPVFLQLSGSAMLELPAFTLAVTSFLWLSKYIRSGRAICLIVSAASLGCALQIKLTAGLFALALPIEYGLSHYALYGQPRASSGAPHGRWIRDLIMGGSVFISVFFAIAICCHGQAYFSTMWASHFSAGTRSAAAGEGYGFHPSSLLEFVSFGPFVLGVLLILSARRWEVLPEALLFAIIFVVHILHRPFWSYYRLHFAIPMAWLGGIGIADWLKMLHVRTIGKGLLPRSFILGGIAAWATAIAMAVSHLPSIIGEFESLSVNSATEIDAACISALEKNSRVTRWIFTDRLIDAFWVRLPVPPQLAVIPSKRIWSGQITSSYVIRWLEEYKPEQILLRSDVVTTLGISDYLKVNYRIVRIGAAEQLYIRKEAKHISE